MKFYYITITNIMAVSSIVFIIIGAFLGLWLLAYMCVKKPTNN
jgi:hypothetical protein